MSAASLPLIADIRRNALDDGPGIRSTVFFKGCPLACVWCQNPETLDPGRQLQRQGGQCIGCGGCAEACPHHAVEFSRGALRRHDARACQLCGSCVEACPPAALRLLGRRLEVPQLVQELLRDEPFFRNSGGGVTFSGGEPTLWLDYLEQVAAQLARQQIHQVLQTCGMFRMSRLQRRLLPLLDLVFFDVKLVDPAAHRRFTGRGNRIILGNLRQLAQRIPDRLLPRVPLVPGITDTDDNLQAIARLLVELGLPRVALLPYNPLWIPKRRELLDDLPYAHERFMDPAQLQRCRRVMTEQGLLVE